MVLLGLGSQVLHLHPIVRFPARALRRGTCRGGHNYCGPNLWAYNYMGVSENRGPQYSTLNSRILIIRTPNQVPLIFGKSHMGPE